MNVNEMLVERGKTHGDFEAHAAMSQTFKYILRDSKAWDTLDPHMQEALDMIVHKIARILVGNPTHVDHWDDIAGYATLVSNILNGE